MPSFLAQKTASLTQKTAQPTADLTLICLILKVFLKTAPATAIAQHLAVHPPEPTQFLQLLRIHRLTPVVYLTLKQSALLSALPHTLQMQLAQQHQRLMHRSLQLTTETIRLIQAFQSARIRVLPLKGTLLSQQLYGSFIYRAPGDIDLLIEPDAYPNAITLLESLGYHWSLANQPWPATQQQLYVEQEGEITYQDPNNHISVDLHIRWSKNRYFFPFSFEEAWQQAVQLPMTTERSIPVLCLNHQFLYLSAHGAKHGWNRLSWLLDVAQLLQSSDGLDVRGLDVSSLQTTAQDLGIQRSIEQALQLTEQWFCCDLPHILHIHPSQSAAVQWLIAAASNHILDKQPQSTNGKLDIALTPQSLWEWRYQLSLNPSISYRTACFTHFLFSAQDWQVILLPKMLWFLYPILRPFRYAWRLKSVEQSEKLYKGLQINPDI